MPPTTLPVQFGSAKLHANLSVASLVELALARGEGQLAANGALQCDTGERTGRSPDDKFLEDTAGIHGNIDWGKVNQAITPANFEALEALALKHLSGKGDIFRFDGYAGADPAYRLKVSVFTEEAWHSLFAKTLFINVPDAEMASFKADWTIINACGMKITNPAEFGLKTHIGIVQSLEKKTVVIVGTEYAGEMKKSIFYAMNYDLPDMGVFPMHCSCNVARNDPSNVALFFGLSGTGKTTLSADLAQELGVPFLEERMRQRLESGFDLHRLTPEDWRQLIESDRAAQRAEEQRCTQGFVADRSSLDYAAFWLHYQLHEDAQRTERFVQAMVEEARGYDRILLFPHGVLPLVDDGVRSTNPWTQLRFQTILEGLVGRYSTGERIYRVPASPDFGARMAGVRRELGLTSTVPQL